MPSEWAKKIIMRFQKTNSRLAPALAVVEEQLAEHMIHGCPQLFRRRRHDERTGWFELKQHLASVNKQGAPLPEEASVHGELCFLLQPTSQ
jgi:hypothetical protein